jgi:hypothetical protein
MSEKADQIITYIALAMAFGWVVWRSIKKSEDPARTAFKWLLTLGILVYIRFSVFPMADKGGMAAFSAVASCMICARDVHYLAY